LLGGKASATVRAIVDLRNPDKRPPTPLAAKVMMVAFAVTALAAFVLARADDGREPLGGFLEKLGVASQGTDVSTALCFASVLVAGVFVLRYVVTLGGPEDAYRKQRRARALRRRARGLAEH
jgi:hypothetical protein